MSVLERPRRPAVLSAPKAPVIEEPITNQIPITSFRKVSENEGDTNGFDFYQELGIFHGPIHFPRNFNFFAIPYMYGNTGPTSRFLNWEMWTMVDGRNKIETIFSDQIRGKQSGTGSPTKLPLRKYIQLHTNYLRTLIKFKNKPEAKSWKFMWSPLIVGINGEECLMRFNLANFLLKYARTEMVKIFPLDSLEKYSKRLEATFLPKTPNFIEWWSQAKISKDKLVKIRTLYSNALHELTLIHDVFLDDDMIKNDHIVSEATKIRVQLGEVGSMAGNSSIFAKIDSESFGLEINGANTNNILIADIISPTIIRWYKSYISLNLQITNYHQVYHSWIENRTTKTRPDIYHKLLFIVGNSILTKIEELKKPLVEIMDNFDNSTLGQNIKDHFLQFIDLNSHLKEINQLEPVVTNLLHLHAIQHYWSSKEFDKAVKLGLNLASRVRKIPRPNGFDTISSSEITEEDQEDSGEEIGHSSDNQPLVQKMEKLWEKITTSSSVEQRPKTDPNDLAQKIINQVCKQVVLHIRRENDTIWYTGVSKKTNFPVHPFRVLTEGKIPEYANGKPMDILQDIELPENDTTVLLEKIVEIKAKTDAQSLSKIKTNTNEFQWWNTMGEYLKSIQNSKDLPKHVTLLELLAYFQDMRRKYE